MWTGLLIRLSILVISVHKCQSCDCPSYESIQGYRCLPSITCLDDRFIQDFCRSDFCIEALIDSEITTNGSKYKDIVFSNYTFRVLRIIRLSPRSMKAIRMHTFFTPSEADMCGVEVRRGSIYLFCGHLIEGLAVITSCDFVKRTETLSLNERSFFLIGYKKINCFEFDSDFRPVIDYNIRQKYMTTRVTNTEENSTRSELDLV